VQKPGNHTRKRRGVAKKKMETAELAGSVGK
jgi:hypothetical protein